MNKNVRGLFVVVVVLVIIASVLSDRFFSAQNIENVLRRTALFGVLAIAVAPVIIAGGIDLAVGSVVGLTGTLFPFLATAYGVPLPISFLIILLMGLLIGVFHGALIAKGKLAPFIVTLCGLLLYRGAARTLTEDRAQGFGSQIDSIRDSIVGRISIGDIGLPIPFILLIILLVTLWFILRRLVIGRYLFAVGSNETAARYSGVPVEKITIASYIWCGFFSALGGALFVLDINSAQPADFGNFYELYAIAAAVLGGCSLKGGEGSVLGLFLGTLVMQLLRNVITLVGVPTQLEYAVIGAVILSGVGLDQYFKLRRARRR